MNPLTVVSNAHPKRSFAVSNLSLDAMGMGVVERVSECFAGDAIHFVANNRIQVARPAFDYQLKSCRILSGQFFTERSDRFRQVVRGGGGISQTIDCFASLRDRVIGALERLCELVLGFSRRQEVVDDLETKHQSLKTLEQRVMQLSRNARTLGDALVQSSVEFASKLPQAKPMQRPEQRQHGGDNQRAEPRRLIVSRRDDEVDRAARLIPGAIPGCCDHLESIRAGRQTAVQHLSAAAGILPFAVAAVEPVTKPQSLWIGEAQSGVANFNVATARRQPYVTGLRAGKPVVVGVDVLDVEKRRERVA